MLKHGAVTQSKVADVETQRKLHRTDDAENTEEAARTDDVETQRKPLHSQRSTATLSTNHKNADTVKSAIHVAETARDLRC
jgi:hypothetical protein